MEWQDDGRRGVNSAAGGWWGHSSDLAQEKFSLIRLLDDPRREVDVVVAAEVATEPRDDLKCSELHLKPTRHRQLPDKIVFILLLLCTCVLHSHK